MLELSVIETTFTPWQSLAGGVLIGLASVLLMLSLGRIMGATGILAGVLTPSAHPDKGWRLAILAGMVSGPLALLVLTGASESETEALTTLLSDAEQSLNDTTDQPVTPQDPEQIDGSSSDATGG